MEESTSLFNNNTIAPHREAFYTELQSILIISAMVTCSLISTFGNFMTFYAYRKVRSLQTETNFFILSLASADMIIAVCIVNVHTMYMIIGWPYGTLSYGLCVLWLCVDYWVYQVSVFGVILVAVDRYCSIKYPVRYKVQRTPSRVKWAITAKWVISFIMWVPIILIFGYKTETKTRLVRDRVCDVGFAENISAAVFGHVVAYVIPIFIIIYLVVDTVNILLNLKNLRCAHVHKTDQADGVVTAHHTYVTTEAVEILHTGFMDLIVPVVKKKYEDGGSVVAGDEDMILPPLDEIDHVIKPRDINKTLPRQSFMTHLSDYQWIAMFNLLLGITFVVNVLPLSVMAITRAICARYDRQCVSQEMWYFGYVMCYMNSMLNPFCYAFGNKNFKQAFKEVLCAKKQQGGYHGYHETVRGRTGTDESNV